MSLVVATGVFEFIHPGHLLFLNEAKKLGKKLVVVIARDVNVSRSKSHSFVPEKQRLEVVKALKIVDDAVLGDEIDMFKTIEALKPEVIALGFDQDFNEEKIAFELKKRSLKAKVVRVNAYHAGSFSSSKKIIDFLKNRK